jgi:hypothetical protein
MTEHHSLPYYKSAGMERMQLTKCISPICQKQRHTKCVTNIHEDNQQTKRKRKTLNMMTQQKHRTVWSLENKPDPQHVWWIRRVPMRNNKNESSPPLEMVRLVMRWILEAGAPWAPWCWATASWGALPINCSHRLILYSHRLVPVKEMHVSFLFSFFGRPVLNYIH